VRRFADKLDKLKFFVKIWESLSASFPASLTLQAARIQAELLVATKYFNLSLELTCRIFQYFHDLRTVIVVIRALRVKQ
jgi:hypothetical protein